MYKHLNNFRIKNLLLGLLLVFTIPSFGQTVYNPARHTAISKPFGAVGFPIDARSFFYDAVNFKYRPYVSTAEALTYLPTQFRRGFYDIIINTGGTLSAGVITGGRNVPYWFADGIADADLVVKQTNVPEINAQIGVEPPGDVIIANVSVAGTYPEYSGLVVTTGDLASGLVQFRRFGSTWSKFISPIALGSYVNKTSDISRYSKNIFDLTQPYLVSGRGIGTDGVIYTLSSEGSVIGLPVQASTQYVISGAANLRGLRFEKADGTLVSTGSFIGAIANGTPFTTPVGTVRISFQVWMFNNSASANTLQVERGSTVTTYSAYKPYVQSIDGSEVRNYDKDIYSKTEVDGFISPLQIQVASNADKISSLTTRKTYTGQIIPSATYNYTPFTITEMADQRGWYFAKSIKTIRSVGVFLYKNTSNGTINQNVRIQVLHKRGSTVTILANKTILPADLAKFNTAGIIGGYANYEQKVDFTAPITLAVDDRLFVSIQCASKLYPIYGQENATLSTGEWNSDGVNCYRSWIPTTSSTTFSDIPSLPAPEVNYNALHFYNYTETPVNVISELDYLNSKVVNVSTTIVAGKNKFNKATMYVSGSGIGSDGNVFALAGYGRSQNVLVKANTQYVISGTTALRGLRFEKADGTLISYIGTINNGTPFTTPPLTEKIRFQIHGTGGNPDLVQVEEGSTVTAFQSYTETVYASALNGNPLLATGSTTTALTDFEILLPKNVFSGFNDTPQATSGNPRTESVNTWVQKFIRERKDLFINGTANSLLLNKRSNTANVDLDSVVFNLSGTGFLSKRVSISRVSVKYSLLATQFPKTLYIGDSMTEPRSKNGVVVGAGAMWSMPKEISIKNYVDNNNAGYQFLNLGKDFVTTATVFYKGQNISIKGGAQGKGGWTAFGYLRHPFRMWVGSKQGAWDLLGLTTSLGRNYVSGQADNKIIASTNYGVTAPVISANSYDLLVFENQISNLGTWTGSAPQIAAVQSWINAVAAGNATQNEFFDINKTGSNRFSINRWLNQYKTLASDGVTRLVVGSTAGTKVTNVNDYDICLPTHITPFLGENDRLFYNDFVQISNDIIEMANAVHAEYPNIEVGIGLSSIPGDMFPERNTDYSGFFYQNHHNAKYDFYKELSSRFGTLSQQKTNKLYLIPTWHIGTPLSNSVVREVISEDQPNKIYQIGNDDYNHVGYWYNRSAGVQIYNWIAYTFN